MSDLFSGSSTILWDCAIMYEISKSGIGVIGVPFMPKGTIHNLLGH